MTIYTRKKGEFVALTREQARQWKRTSEVMTLQGDAQKMARSVRALAAWLLTVQRKALRLDVNDLAVTKLPNVDRLLSQADAIDKAIKILKQGWPNAKV